MWGCEDHRDKPIPTFPCGETVVWEVSCNSNLAGMLPAPHTLLAGVFTYLVTHRYLATSLAICPNPDLLEVKAFDQSCYTSRRASPQYAWANVGPIQCC